MIVGVQPLRAAPIFEDADAGTPQRFVWFPVSDPDRPKERPEEPPPLDLPAWPGLFADNDDEGVVHFDRNDVLASRMGDCADGPQRAIRCAMAIRDAVQALGIEVRAGLHTGECEIRGDDIGGIGVHIGARVSALAGPNDVLVSSTLRDLVIGSGLEFEDRGSYELKGVPGEWRIFAVA